MHTCHHPASPPFYKTPPHHILHLITTHSQHSYLSLLFHSLNTIARKERKKPSQPTTMADRDRPHHVQVHTTTTHRYDSAVNPQHHHEGGIKSFISEKGPSATQIMAVLVGVPIGGTLLFLAGISLIGSLIGLAVVTPLFILFSPVLVPAALGIGLAVAGILASDACGVMGLMSFAWVMNYIRQTQGTVPEQLDYAKRRAADMVDYVGQKTKEVGQDIQSKAQDVKRT